MRVCRESFSISVCDSFFLLVFQAGMWDLIVLVPGHCLSLHFIVTLRVVFFWSLRLPSQLCLGIIFADEPTQPKIKIVKALSTGLLSFNLSFFIL